MKKILIAFIIFTAAIPTYTLAKEKNITSSATNATKVEFKSFFKGDIELQGIEQDKDGRIISIFTGKDKVSWEENRGVIQQSMVYGDGKKDSRTWLLTFDNDTDFGIVVHDLNGIATGQTGNNLVNMSYTLYLPKGDKKQNVQFREVVYFINQSTAISIADNNLGIKRTTFLHKKAE